MVRKIPLVKANSSPDEWLFLEEIPFDVPFDLSLFRTKSENEINETVLDPDFMANIEVQYENKSIDEYILKSPQSPINTIMTPYLSKQLSITLSSPLFPSNSTIIPSEFHSSPPFIPTLPHQPIITHS